MSRSRSVVILNRADSCHLEQCLILVTIDGAGGGVKDLEHRSGVQQRFVPSRFFTVAQNDSERALRMT